MSGLAFPDGLEPGPLYDLMTELHYLHALAGWPSITVIAREVSCRRAPVGRSSIHKLFTRPELPNRKIFFDVVEWMAQQAPRTSADEWCDKLDARWSAAYDAERLAIRLEEVLQPPVITRIGSAGRGAKLDPGTDLQPRTAELRGLLPDPARSHALFVGSGDFQDARLPTLPGVYNGMMSLYSAMTQPSLGSFPLVDHTVVLQNESVRQVLDVAGALCDKADDVLLLYLASHGLVSSSGELYLATPDTDVDDRAMRYTALPYAAVRDLMASSRARRKIVILDSCYSGRALSVMGPMSGAAAMDSTTIVLASTGPYTASFVTGPDQIPAMTRMLGEILTDGIATGPEYLDFYTIYEEIKLRFGSQPFPMPALHMQRSSTSAGDVALGKNPRYELLGPAIHFIRRS